MSTGAGCGKDPDPISECSACESQGLATYGCWGGLFSSSRRYGGSVCMPYGSPEVNYQCNAEHGTPTWSTKFIDLLPCDSYGTAGYGGGYDESTGVPADYDCSGWHPSYQIWGFGSPTYISGSFVSNLVADPTPLAVCDAARVVPLSGGYFEVADASSGTLLYELGFRNGDRIDSINGYDLSSVDDTASAFGIEYLENGETEYTVSVTRGGSSVQLQIEISYPTR